MQATEGHQHRRRHGGIGVGPSRLIPPAPFAVLSAFDEIPRPHKHRRDLLVAGRFSVHLRQGQRGVGMTVHRPMSSLLAAGDEAIRSRAGHAEVDAASHRRGMLATGGRAASSHERHHALRRDGHTFSKQARAPRAIGRLSCHQPRPAPCGGLPRSRCRRRLFTPTDQRHQGSARHDTTTQTAHAAFREHRLPHHGARLPAGSLGSDSSTS